MVACTTVLAVQDDTGPSFAMQDPFLQDGDEKTLPGIAHGTRSNFLLVPRMLPAGPGPVTLIRS